jgi:3-methylcrotonyl-CoA carboxylase alpha subunit
MRKQRFSTEFSSSSIQKQFKKILIANRGEIACRVQRTAHQMGIETVAVYSEADANAQHVKNATEAYLIGPPPAVESYLNYEKIIQVCKESGAEAVHPGYGFLSENADFCRACAEAGIEFIGPPVKAIEAMGSKSASKEIMIAAGVPVTPGYHGKDQSVEKLFFEAKQIGFPILIKAVLGGGGKGMRIVYEEKDFQENLDACIREGKASFGDGRVLLEKYLVKPRHIELQIFGDKFGNIIHLFERDCSVQRRHQKVLEEAPAPFMSNELREKMGNAAIAAAKAVGYVGAGTVEFLLDQEDKEDKFYFMEMNTRLQVEHPVTEMITKQDLVELQLKIAAGFPLPLAQKDLKIHGHAIEARIYAENPYNNFLPGSGTLHYYQPPFDKKEQDVRVDTGLVQGDQVSIFYDPMIAKLIVFGKNRDESLQKLQKALKKYQIVGLDTNIEFVLRTILHPIFQKGGVNTSFLSVFGQDLVKPLTFFSSQVKILGAISLLLLESSASSNPSSSSSDPWNHIESFRSMDILQRHLKLICVTEQQQQEEEKEKTEIVDVQISSLPSSSSEEEEKEEVNKKKCFEICLDKKKEETFQVKAQLLNTKKRGTKIGIKAGDFLIQIDHRIFKGTAVIEEKDQLLHVFCNDGTQKYAYQFKIPLLSFEKEQTSTASPVSKILTPMPGKIIKVFVKKQEKIKANQPLLIMEAMKMEHIVRATKDGQIEDVFCQVGEFVNDGQVLIQLTS